MKTKGLNAVDYELLTSGVNALLRHTNGQLANLIDWSTYTGVVGKDKFEEEFMRAFQRIVFNARTLDSIDIAHMDIQTETFRQFDEVGVTKIIDTIPYVKAMVDDPMRFSNAVDRIRVDTNNKINLATSGYDIDAAAMDILLRMWRSMLFTYYERGGNCADVPLLDIHYELDNLHIDRRTTTGTDRFSDEPTVQTQYAVSAIISVICNEQNICDMMDVELSYCQDKRRGIHRDMKIESVQILSAHDADKLVQLFAYLFILACCNVLATTRNADYILGKATIIEYTSSKQPEGKE